MLFSRIPVIAIWNGRSKSVLGSFSPNQSESGLL